MATQPGFGRIGRITAIARFVQGGVVKSFHWRMQVSFDLDIFLSSDEFPESEFFLIAGDLGTTVEREPDRLGRNWHTVIDDSAVFCSVRELVGDHLFGFEYGYKWDLSISANSGCPPRARWAQFAITFHALTLLPDSTAYDPQTGVFFTSPTEYLDFARATIPRWPKLPLELRRIELMDTDGRPRF